MALTHQANLTSSNNKLLSFSFPVLDDFFFPVVTPIASSAEQTTYTMVCRHSECHPPPIAKTILPNTFLSSNDSIPNAVCDTAVVIKRDAIRLFRGSIEATRHNRQVSSCALLEERLSPEETVFVHMSILFRTVRFIVFMMLIAAKH